MSFYLDDDDDDNEDHGGFVPSSSSLPSQGGGRPSLASLLCSSQKSTANNVISSQHSQQPSSQPVKWTQQLSSVFDKNDVVSPSDHYHNDAPTVDFVCRNCGSRDAYLDETTNDIICNVCFTQSQTHVDSSQQQFDFDDAVNMAHRSRDGRIQPVAKQSLSKSGKHGVIGSRAKPLSDYDNTQKQPSLSECLQGFQTVLRASCDIVSRDLLIIPSLVKSNSSNKEDYNDHNNNNDDDQRKQKQIARHHIFKTVRDLWEAYLWSWHDGAERYATWYPQVRFSFRDLFLQGHIKDLLYQTLAARATKNLKKQIQQEIDNVHGEHDDDTNISTYDRMDDETGDNARRVDDDSDLSTSSDQSAESKVPDHLIISFAKISSKKRKVLNNMNAQNRKKPRKSDEIAMDVNEVDSDKILQSKVSHEQENSNDTFSVNDTEDVDDYSVTSDLSKGIGNERIGNESDQHIRTNTLAKLVYFHMSKRANDKSDGRTGHDETSQKKQPKFGRKEAALILQPSLLMVMGMITIATAPFGVSESNIIRWVQNGTLPLLNAFDVLLSPTQREFLNPIAPFFRFHTLPTVTSLKRVVSCIHVACGYKPPSTHLNSGITKNQGQQQDKPLLAPGRTIIPNNVPSILIALVADLGLSQQVLNYSLALMGYPLSRQLLSGLGANDSDLGLPDPRNRSAPIPKTTEDEGTWLPPSLIKASPDRLRDLSRILAVVVVACKLIPNWHDRLEYIIESSNDINPLMRLIPWDGEHFRLVENGQMEKNYLSFLEESILHSDKHILPKFINSLGDGEVPESKEEPRDGKVCGNNVMLRTIHRPAAETPTLEKSSGNKSRKGSEKSQAAKTRAHSNGKAMEQKVVYTLTAPYERSYVRFLQPPVGPLIEYFAYKTETPANKILNYLISLDEELEKSSLAASSSVILSTREAFELILPSYAVGTKK
jgi:hypothetical protein